MPESNAGVTRLRSLDAASQFHNAVAVLVAAYGGQLAAVEGEAMQRIALLEAAAGIQSQGAVQKRGPARVDARGGGARGGPLGDLRPLGEAHPEGKEAPQAEGKARELVWPSAEALAGLFHHHYERLAPEHGYRTRESTALLWDQVPEPNKSLMIATAAAVLRELEFFMEQQRGG